MLINIYSSVIPHHACEETRRGRLGKTEAGVEIP